MKKHLLLCLVVLSFSIIGCQDDDTLNELDNQTLTQSTIGNMPPPPPTLDYFRTDCEKIEIAKKRIANYTTRYTIKNLNTTCISNIEYYINFKDGKDTTFVSSEQEIEIIHKFPETKKTYWVKFEKRELDGTIFAKKRRRTVAKKIK